MGEQEFFTLVVAIATVMIIGRAVAGRLGVPDAVVMVILGVLASLIPPRSRTSTCPRTSMRLPRRRCCHGWARPSGS
jgi:hypothetical protein